MAIFRRQWGHAWETILNITNKRGGNFELTFAKLRSREAAGVTQIEYYSPKNNTR